MPRDRRSGAMPLMRLLAAPARALISLAALSLLAGCSLALLDFSDPDKRLRGKLPQTWEADVSCPGCSEHRMTLTLFPDGSFRQRDSYAGNSDAERFHDIGLWTLVRDDGIRLLLRGNSLVPRQLGLRADGNLQMLDERGREIRSIRDYVLARASQVDPVSDPMPLLGLYFHDAGAAWFNECRTGQRWRIAPSPQADALARQYEAVMSARQGERRATLLELSGRPGAPEPDRPVTLDVSAEARFWSDASCRRDLLPPAQPLQETTWALISLRGQALPDSGIAQPAHLKFRRGGRLTGTTGCNRLQAAYTRDGSRLVVIRPRITRMTCPPALQEQERALLSVLRTVRTFRMSGNLLELMQGETVLAGLVVSEMP